MSNMMINRNTKPLTGIRLSEDGHTLERCTVDFAALMERTNQQAAINAKKDVKKICSVDMLTEDQVKDLAEKYDPENITQEEYYNFINDLCGYGAFDAKDKNYVGAQSKELSLTRLDSFGPEIRVISMNSPLYGLNDDTIFNRIRLGAVTQTLNPVTGAFEESYTAKLYAQLAEILTKVQTYKNKEDS